MDRLARNLGDLGDIVQTLTQRGVHVEFIKEQLSFTGEDSPVAHLMLSVMKGFAEFEHALVLERQREGIALAQQRGAYRGRKKSLSDQAIVVLRQRVAAGEKKTALALEFRISRETLYQYLPGLSAESLGVQAEDAERSHLQGGLQLTIILICLIDSSEFFCMMLTKATSSTPQSTRVLRLRIKDKHAAALTAMAREVNFVWNYVNDLVFKVWLRERRFMSEYDIDAYTAGASKAGLNLHSTTIQSISKELVTRRKQCKKVKLRWRVSGGARRSLGWIPFKASALRYRGGQVLFSNLDKPLSLWDSYGLAGYTLGAGNFSEDARGRWYINITVKVDQAPRSVGKSAIGIDLGLKDVAATSSGDKVAAEQFYRDMELRLGVAQRARKKDRVRAIHATIAHRRKDFLHKLSTRLVHEHGAIFVGDVNASKLAKTRMAKSVLNVGWSMFRDMLKYKCDDAGVWFEIVNEAYSTQTCSTCGTLPESRPRGIAGLGIREWTCSECGAHHDRDVNAAKNILARGHARLAGGILVLSA